MSSRRIFGLSGFLVFIVLPILYFAAVVVNRLIDAERATSERLLAKNADELSLAFDQEVLATIRALEVLGASEALRINDLGRFHRIMARAVLTQPSWSAVLLHDTNLQWVASSRVPYGSELPRPPEPESIRKVIDSGEPTIGKIIKIPTNRMIASTHGFAVRVPVKNEKGKVRYVLSAILSTEPPQELVTRFSFAPGEIARALMDTEGILGARSRDPEKHVGGPGSESIRKILSPRPDSGLERNFTLEHVEVYTAFKRSPFSGWYALIAVPAEILEAGAHQIQNWVFAIGLGLLAFSAALTFYFSSSVKRALIADSNGAAAVARGEIHGQGLD